MCFAVSKPVGKLAFEQPWSAHPVIRLNLGSD
jgi:hypothetical protein